MKPDWITRAIGRHLVNLPASAKLSEAYTLNKVKIEPLLIRNRQHFEYIIDMREAELKGIQQIQRKLPLFIERVKHSNNSVTLVSWTDPASDAMYLFDTYFLIGTKALRYSGDVSIDKKILHWDYAMDLAKNGVNLNPAKHRKVSVLSLAT